MRLTYFGANSWLLELGQQRILVDPWLVGSLVFGNLTWLFKGDHSPPIAPLPQNIDLILLSQGLEDHAHRPTLEQLDHGIPVIASPNGAKVVQDLGYTQVTSLAPGETTTVGQLEVRAMPGAPIGLQVENAFLLKQLNSGTTLYYEPHGYPPEGIADFGPVDVVISPIVNLALPLLGPIIKGHSSASSLAQKLQPQVFLPTAAGGDIDYDGVLNQVLRTEGSVEELRDRLVELNLPTRVITPVPNQPLELKLTKSVA